jgi:hypothetical protein
MCLAAAVGVGCNGGTSLPTAPSEDREIVVPQLPTSGPAQGALTLRGRVSEAAPTSITEIHPAVVTIVDGEDAGKSAQTDADGFYEIAGLRPGTFMVAASAE